MSRRVLLLSCSLLMVVCLPPGARAQAPAPGGCLPAAQELLAQARATEDFERQVDLATQALRADPRCLAAYLLLGNLYLTAERYLDVVALMERAKALDPRNVEVRGLLILAYFKLQQWAKIVEEGQAARDLQVTGFLGFLGLYVGWAYEHLGDIEKAIEWWELGLADPAALRGTLETELIEAYRVALSRGFDATRALKLARLLSIRESYVEALGLLEQVIQAMPPLPEAFYWLGAVHVQLARMATTPTAREAHRTAARRALERYLELEPQGEYAAEARALLQQLSTP